MKRLILFFLLLFFMFTSFSCSLNKKLNILSESYENKDRVNLILYFPNEKINKLIPEERNVRLNKSLERTIIQELLSGPLNGSPFMFPRGTKILSLSRRNDSVYLNLSKDFTKNFSGNNETAQMMIYSIVNSLTEIPGIKRVEIKVNGKKFNLLGGSFKIEGPLYRNRSLFMRDKNLNPSLVLEKQLNFEKLGKWLEAYILASDEGDNEYRKYYHDYVIEMEEVREVGFTDQGFEVDNYVLDKSGNKAKVKVNFYTEVYPGQREKSSDIYFNCIKIDGVWMVDWLTAQ